MDLIPMYRELACASLMLLFSSLPGNAAWWPDSCGQAIAIVTDEGDTLTTRYKCMSDLYEVKRFLNGQYHGKYQAWYANGQMKSDLTYNRDRLDGVATSWAPTGEVVLTATYKLGKKTGTYRDYYVPGKPKEIAHYNQDGKKHGLSRTWFENGSLDDSTVFDQGKIAEIREYFQAGGVRYWAKYEGDRMMWCDSYAPGGKVIGKVRNGKGKYLVYAKDGEQRYVREYLDGKKVTSRRLKPGESPDLE